MKRLDWKLVAVIITCVVVSIVIGEQLLRVRLRAFTYVADGDSEQRFIKWITPAAKDVGKRYGIPWQAMVMQMALETGWGKSSLLRRYNNFGGIKAVAGESAVVMDTNEQTTSGQVYTISSKFAVFRTPYEGLEGYAKFIHRNKRYANALKYPRDPYRYIAELKKAGYATAVNYVATIHGMLNKYY